MMVWCALVHSYIGSNVWVTHQMKIQECGWWSPKFTKMEHTLHPSFTLTVCFVQCTSCLYMAIALCQLIFLTLTPLMLSALTTSINTLTTRHLRSLFDLLISMLLQLFIF